MQTGTYNIKLTYVCTRLPLKKMICMYGEKYFIYTQKRLFLMTDVEDNSHQRQAKNNLNGLLKN